MSDEDFVYEATPAGAPSTPSDPAVPPPPSPAGTIRCPNCRRDQPESNDKCDFCGQELRRLAKRRIPVIPLALGAFALLLAAAFALGLLPFGGTSNPSAAGQTASAQQADPSPTFDISSIPSVTPAAPQATPVPTLAPTFTPAPVATVNVANVPSVTPAPALPTAATNGPALGQASTPRDRVLLVQSGLLNDEQIQPFRAAGFQVMQYGTGDALALYDAINSVGQKVEVILVSNGVDTSSRSTLSQTVELFIKADNWLVAIAVETQPAHNVDAIEALTDRVPGPASKPVKPDELDPVLRAEIGKYTQ